MPTLIGALGDYRAGIAWGDGQTSSGTITADPTVAGLFDVDGTHTYARAGVFVPVVTVNDQGGASASATGRAVVSDAPLTVQGIAMNATASTLFTGTVATFIDANPLAVAGDFLATITWGDGQVSAGQVAAGAAGFQVTGTHTYSEKGRFPVLVSILDFGGAVGHATTTATVAGSALVVTTAGLAVNATEGQSFTAVVANFTDANVQATSDAYTVMIDWGDGQTSPGSVQANPLQAGQFAVAGSHVYAEEGTESVKVTVSSRYGAAGSAQVTATIADAALTAQGGSLAATVGLPLNAVLATFTDANPAGEASDYTAMIDWGDGQTTAGTIAAIRATQPVRRLGQSHLCLRRTGLGHGDDPRPGGSADERRKRHQCGVGEGDGPGGQS